MAINPRNEFTDEDYDDDDYTVQPHEGHILTGFFYSLLEAVGYVLILAVLVLVVLMFAH
jgi:hypothetical protein